MTINPRIENFVCKFGVIIDRNGLSKTDSLSGFRQCGGDFVPTDGGINQKQWASAGILIDNGENAEGATVGQSIAHKVHRPTLLGH